MNGIYLAISMTTNCNLRCFYCKETGESISGVKGTISYEDFCRIVRAAYRNGITKFRLTGGECTTVNYFGKAIDYIMAFGDTKINICSNGYKLYDYIDIIEKYKDRIHVRISVDTLSENLNNYYFPKHLNESTRMLAKSLIDRGIETRFNIVVTTYNMCEIKMLIKESLDLGVNLKLLDLYVQEEYLGGEGSSEQFWNCTYQSLVSLKPFLSSITDEYIDNYWDDSAYGIPMGAYKKKDQTIILKDSSQGAHFAPYCIEKCENYKQCQEGIYVPFVSVGNILHINGCHNKTLKWDLSNCSDEQLNYAFKEMLALFKNLSIRTESSDIFRFHNTYIEK